MESTPTEGQLDILEALFDSCSVIRYGLARDDFRLFGNYEGLLGDIAELNSAFFEYRNAEHSLDVKKSPTIELSPIRRAILDTLLNDVYNKDNIFYRAFSQTGAHSLGLRSEDYQSAATDPELENDAVDSISSGKDVNSVVQDFVSLLAEENQVDNSLLTGTGQQEGIEFNMDKMRSLLRQIPKAPKLMLSIYRGNKQAMFETILEMKGSADSQAAEDAYFEEAKTIFGPTISNELGVYVNNWLSGQAEVVGDVSYILNLIEDPGEMDFLVSDELPQFISMKSKISSSLEYLSNELETLSIGHPNISRYEDLHYHVAQLSKAMSTVDLSFESKIAEVTERIDPDTDPDMLRELSLAISNLDSEKFIEIVPKLNRLNSIEMGAKVVNRVLLGLGTNSKNVFSKLTEIEVLPATEYAQLREDLNAITAKSIDIDHIQRNLEEYVAGIAIVVSLCLVQFKYNLTLPNFENLPTNIGRSLILEGKIGDKRKAYLAARKRYQNAKSVVEKRLRSIASAA